MGRNAELTIGVVCNPTHGGSGVVAAELARQLARRGYGVHVFSRGTPPRLSGAAVPGGLRVHALSEPSPWQSNDLAPDEAVVRAVTEVHRDAPLDLIHAHYALPHALTAAEARRRCQSCARDPAPLVVTTVHGSEVARAEDRTSCREALLRGLRASSAVTTVSNQLARRLARVTGTEPIPRVEVVHNFIDSSHYRPLEGRRASRRSRPPFAVHVSTFRSVKRVPWLVDAFALASAGTRAELRLVGDGPERAVARGRCAERGLADRVRFDGAGAVRPELLSRATLYAQASADESFGLAALEAMACGTPVVATAVGGVPEVVEDGVGGRLVPPGDLYEFAFALRGLIVDPARAARMGEQAHRRAVERFSAEQIVPRFEAVFARAASSPRVPCPIGP